MPTTRQSSNPDTSPVRVDLCTPFIFEQELVTKRMPNSVFVQKFEARLKKVEQHKQLYADRMRKVAVTVSEKEKVSSSKSIWIYAS